MLKLRNCRLVGDLVEGYDGQTADVAIRNGRIDSIEPCQPQDNSGCNVIDAGGKTLLPGLIDMHVHLPIPDHNFSDFLLYPARKSFLAAAQYAQALLRQGFTTIRDVGSDQHYPAHAVRDAIREGVLEGPRIVACGRILTPTEAGNEYFGSMYVEADGPSAVRAAARTELKNGAEFIKMMGTGAMLNPGGVPGRRIIEADEIREAVRVASLRETYVAIHCHGAEGIRVALDSGVRTVEHATFIDGETCRLLSGDNSRGIVPTLYITHSLLRKTKPQDSHAFVIGKVNDDFWSQAVECLQLAYSSNVLIGWGTDVNMQEWREEPGLEFRLRKEHLRCSNIDILKQATIHSARLMGLAHEIGSIAAGKSADLILVDGNPDEDIRVMYGPPALVIRQGKVCTLGQDK